MSSIHKFTISRSGSKCENVLCYIWKSCVCMTPSLSHVQLLRSHGLVAHKAPPSMGFPRQKYFSGLPFPPPGDLPNPEIESTFSEAPALASRLCFYRCATWEAPCRNLISYNIHSFSSTSPTVR